MSHIIGHTSIPRGASVSHKIKLPPGNSTLREVIERLNISADDLESIVRYTQQVADKVNGILQGRTNNQFDATLDANVASTTFMDPRIGFDSAVGFIPTTANAAAEYGTMYQSTTTNGSVTFVHRNTAAADKTFRFFIIG